MHTVFQKLSVFLLQVVGFHYTDSSVFKLINLGTSFPDSYLFVYVFQYIATLSQ